MDWNYDDCANLVELIDATFDDVDDRMCVDLRKSNAKVIELLAIAKKLEAKYPFLKGFWGSDDEALNLTVEDRKAINEHLELQRQVDEIERLHLYYRGHEDCIAYLKRVNAIS